MRTTIRDFATELAFSLLLVLVAEVVVRQFAWDRLWALVAVFSIGHAARAVVTRRRRVLRARGGETAALPR
ncbi:hypothetical protein GTR02_02620 [Kineococcus sp. R8]|uniref:hypothetical protein n=1 Tax=Kineococcus siccus TaxID=2696567 RepID=UPI0014124F03|nr:hypothetical protein [Kineococcus siccus]NAZ80712.1 hypothetical protein [Kineococcus siccus]